MIKPDQIALKLPNFTFTPPTLILKSILFLSLNTLTILVLFADSGVGSSSSSSSTLIFSSSAYDALLISIAFAFSGALTALLHPQSHTLATLCAFYSLASMASALLLLFWALYQTTLTFATPHYRL